MLKLGYDGRLRITGYPLVNSSASLGGDFVVLANDCDLPLQCPPLGHCSPTGDGVCKVGADGGNGWQTAMCCGKQTQNLSVLEQRPNFLVSWSKSHH